MNKLFFILLVLIPLCYPLIVRGQSARGRIVDSATGKPVPGATLSDLSNRAITFSNDDGIFQLPAIPPDDTVKVSCLGYETYTASYRELLQDTLIRLNPVTYSLPPVFVGHYAVNLISKAYKKAAAAHGKYFYGKALDLQFLFVDGLPAECYEFLEDTRTSVDGLVAREVSAARHGVICSRTDSLSIDAIRSLANKLNWYDGKTG
jgi:hypothetical protein